MPKMRRVTMNAIPRVGGRRLALHTAVLGLPPVALVQGAPVVVGMGRNLPTGVTGTLFFTTNDGTHGLELWKGDGTGAGTTLVKDVYPGAASSGPICLTNVNGT